MNVPLEISYRGVEKRSDLDDLIRDKVAWLEGACDHISSCDVAVERLQEHQHTGRKYRVRLDIRVPPRHELAVVRDSSGGNIHESVLDAVREAFDAAWQQLAELTAKQLRETKVHPHQQVQAVVEKLLPWEHCGFLRTVEGNRQIYFHENSVLHGGYARLRIGTGVRFAEEMGENGPQASTVQIVESPSA
jgi:cold shock CspA family protein